MNNEATEPIEIENERLRRVNAELMKEVETLGREKRQEEKIIAHVEARPPAKYDLQWFTRAFDHALERETILAIMIGDLRVENQRLREAPKRPFLFKDVPAVEELRRKCDEALEQLRIAEERVAELESRVMLEQK